jgi:hypothetical protein
MKNMTGLFEVVEVSRISGDVAEDDDDMGDDTRRMWRLVAQTVTGQRFEFDVVAEALRALVARDEVKKNGAKKNVWAGRRFLTSLERSTLIMVIYRIHPDGDMTFFDWWEASAEDVAHWAKGAEPQQFWVF